MKRISSTLLAIAALALLAADAPEKEKPIPPDDAADVKIVLDNPMGARERDAEGNIVGLWVDGQRLREDRNLGAVLYRLRHVRRLCITNDSDLALGALTSWTGLEVVALGRDATDDSLVSLERMKKLKVLEARCNHFTDEGAKSIVKFRDLESLNLEFTGITALKGIGGLRKLKSLHLGHCAITDDALKEIGSLSALEDLDLLDCPITDRGMRYLKGMKLDSLGLAGTKITDRGVAELKDMRTLRSLDLSCQHVTNASLAYLKWMPEHSIMGLPRDPPVPQVPDDPKDVAAIEAALGSLDKNSWTGNVYVIGAQGDTKKPGAWMKHLKGLHYLKELYLPDYVTEDDDLAFLDGLRTLEKLDVMSRKITDSGLKPIGQLKSLRELKLHWASKITADGVKYLGQLENLEVLDLYECSVDDDSLKYLGKLKKLKNLNLSSSKITDSGLASLAGLISLEQLGVCGTPVSDAGLIHLRGLKNLQQFQAGPLVTRAALIELKKSVPHLIVPPPPKPPWQRRSTAP